MGEDVAFGMELRRLLDSFHGGDFGQDLGQEGGRIEQFESAAGAAFGEHLGQFFAHALRRRPGEFSALTFVSPPCVAGSIL